MSDYTCDPDRLLAAGPQSDLERQLIEGYLRAEGYSLLELKLLPKEKARALMRAACRYAGLKMAEIESRSKLRSKIEAPGVRH